MNETERLILEALCLVEQCLNRCLPDGDLSAEERYGSLILAICNLSENLNNK